MRRDSEKLHSSGFRNTDQEVCCVHQRHKRNEKIKRSRYKPEEMQSQTDAKLFASGKLGAVLPTESSSSISGGLNSVTDPLALDSIVRVFLHSQE